MHDTTAIKLAEPGATQPQTSHYGGANGNPRYAALYRHYPTIDYLRRAARRKLPHFAFEYSDGGSGKDDAGIRRNWAALDAVEMVPRYGVMPSLPPCDVELFGRRYAAPIGIAPMGGPAIVWPGADKHLGASRAEGAHSLYARHGRRRHHRRDRRDRARRILASALSLREKRSRHRLRSRAARLGDRLQRAGPHARRAGAHDTRPRSGGRAWRQRFAPGSGHADADGAFAAMVSGAVEIRYSALCHAAPLCRRQRLDQRRHRLCAEGNGRRFHLGGSREISRPLEEDTDRQRHPASGRRREGGRAGRRRSVRVQSRRPSDRGAAGTDRRVAGDRADKSAAARR